MSERIEKLLTIEEVLQRLRVSKHTVYRMITEKDPQKRLEAIRLSQRSIRVREVALEDFLKLQEIQPQEDDGE